MSRSVKAVRNRKKSSSKKQKKVAANEDAETATTESSSDLTERTPLNEKNSRKQRKEERSQPTSLWYDFSLMCGGCCGAIEAVKSVKGEDGEEDLFADDDNIISKFGHTIMHKAVFAPPVKIIRCTQEDDDSVITTPKVLIELAKQYDQERFWQASNANPQDDEDGTVTTSRTSLSITSMVSKRLIPNLSLSAGRSRASKSVKTTGTKKSKKSKSRSSDGRYEI